MAKKLDHILVIDVESTCWDGTPPTGEESEIIEIGLCPLDVATGQRGEKRSLLLRPARSRVSAFCTSLTTITPDMVADGMSFAEACGILKKEYASPTRLWASYGDYDRSMFEKQCKATGVGYPFGSGHLNVKTLFALSRGMTHEIGMAGALEMLGIPLAGTHHRGDDDAWNIAGILAALLANLKGGKAAETARNLIE